MTGGFSPADSMAQLLEGTTVQAVPGAGGVYRRNTTPETGNIDASDGTTVTPPGRYNPGHPRPAMLSTDVRF